MAIVTGKPGRYARSEADKYFDRLLSLTVLISVILGAVTGVALILRHSWLWCLGSLVVLVLYCKFLAGPWLDKAMNHFGRERVRWLRGAQGEALVGWLLQRLDDRWHVFHGILLRDRHDIDHIVVGPTGVWCISTKNFRGLFNEQPDGRIFYNNQPTNVIGEAMADAVELKQRLQALLGSDVPWVEAVLCVPQAWVEFQGKRKNVWVLHQDNLMETLERRPERLDKAQISRCAKAVALLAATAKEIHRRPALTQPSAFTIVKPPGTE